MIRVCHVISGLRTGGAERALARLLAGGLEGKFENHVVSLSGRGTQAAAIEETGAAVHSLDIASPAAGPAGVIKLGQLTKSIRPDLIQGWMYHGNLAATLAAFFVPGAPHCWNIRQSLDDLSGDKWITRQVIRVGKYASGRPRRIIYNSATSAAQHAAFGYRSDRAVVIPNGFETERVKPDLALRDCMRAELGIPEDVTVFAHVARFHPMKDHASFLAAAARCLADGADAWFILAGKDVTPQSTGIVAAVPAEHRERFKFAGEVGDAMPLIQAADVLVVSSRRAEGFPNVLGEGMMAGVACLATDTGDCAAILGGGGLVVRPGDRAALAGEMLRLARDRGLTEALGAAGRERVVQNFGISTAVSAYKSLYEALLTSGPER